MSLDIIVHTYLHMKLPQSYDKIKCYCFIWFHVFGGHFHTQFLVLSFIVTDFHVGSVMFSGKVSKCLDILNLQLIIFLRVDVYANTHN